LKIIVEQDISVRLNLISDSISRGSVAKYLRCDGI